MLSKPKLIIDLKAKTDEIPIVPALQVDISTTHQKSYHLRPPLGIYNLSITQLSQRLTHCCEVLGRMLQANRTPSDFSSDSENQVLLDYLLLTIYAAAEHVDDLESALLTFFPDRKSFKRSPVVKKFKSDLSPVRRRMSGFANAVKHQQARIRVYLVGFNHGPRPMCLTGFYIEGVHNEVVGPSHIFHTQEAVISIPSFLWETLIFAYDCAALLDDAVTELLGTGAMRSKTWPDLPSRPTSALTRLPNFSFDGPHPFERTAVVLQNAPRAEMGDRPIYGSLYDPWSKTEEHSIGEMIGTFVGDGVTRSFGLANPTQIRLQHWE